MKIGFTGTREGMSDYQKKQVIEILENKKPEWCIHGDCMGADAEFHNFAKVVGAKIEIHPPSDQKKRAFCVGDIEKPPFPYLERDHNIVDAADFIIATPKSDYEELRSGTWATIRYARKSNKRIMVLRRENPEKLKTS